VIKKLLLLLIAALLVVIIITVVLVWRHPLATFAWANRRALTNAGLQKIKLETPVGPQAAFVGGAGPTLVFLHGAGDQAGSWSKVAPRFTGSYRLVLVDLPGHGDSAPAAGPLTMTKVLSGTEAVLNHYASGQPVTLVGNSLGAWVALIYARQHPQQVARVVAVDGGPLRGDRPELAKLPATREEARKLFDAVLDRGSPRPPDFVLDDLVRESNNGPMGRIVAARDDYDRYLLASVQDITVPVDLLWGESDELVPLEYAKKMEAQLAAARLTTIPRCGHIPQQECPNTFAAALEKLLQQPSPERKAMAAPVARAK
jgi:pimeloyl-ACP methyl ester carboxylesterase